MRDYQFFLITAVVAFAALFPLNATARSSEEPIAITMTAPASTQVEVAGSQISVVTTGGNKRLSTEPQLTWQKVVGSQPRDTIVIKPETSYQTIDGFGGAFTDAACFNFNKMSAKARNQLFHELFDKSKLALNVCRVCIGASDYATEAYSYCDGKADPELTRFSIAHDQKYILPMLREARQVNPELRIFGSPWSPPGWMKANNSMLGGNMQRRYMSSYAKYFAKFIHAFEKEGVPIYAVTIQNEVDTDQDGQMPACLWPQEYEVDFVTQFLGPTFKKENINTKIWIIDHNYNLWGRALASLESEDLRKFVSGVAWHGYIGDVAKMTQVSNAYPQIGTHWTEGGPDYKDPNYAKDWAVWGNTFTGILRNRAKSITVWNLALDEVGKPNIGPFSCGGMVTINSKTGHVSHSGQYFALAHFSSFVKRGAVCVDSKGDISGVSHVAFKNPDGHYVLVATNSNPNAHAINIRMSDNMAKVDLPPSSVTTLLW